MMHVCGEAIGGVSPRREGHITLHNILQPIKHASFDESIFEALVAFTAYHKLSSHVLASVSERRKGGYERPGAYREIVSCGRLV